jgi:hypothetical protein
MNADRFRVLIKGALGIWRVDAALSFSEVDNHCAISVEAREAATVSWESQPFGAVWRVREPGRRDRVHPSIGPALRSLREILCADRAAGRVLFVSESVG